ncbi:MAG: sulfite exporter TauE/SafE family protein, partial [Gemmatimonadaceae bacterium]
MQALHSDGRNLHGASPARLLFGVLTPDPAIDLTAALRLPLVVVASAVAGAVNSIAGGGTLLTFPALVGLGIPPIVANATSTVALWPGALGSMWGYRRELQGVNEWAAWFALPSLVGGLVGAWLLLRTPPERFDALVPWLVLGATLLFMAQGRLTRVEGGGWRVEKT